VCCWNIAAFLGMFLFAGAATAAAPRTVLGSTCTAPSQALCLDGNCPREKMAGLGQAKEPRSGRTFFLDFPCDLKPDEKLVFILLLHGAGSFDVWARSYFPAVDYKEKYRLVIAAPGAGSASRIWNAQADDLALQNITDSVFAAFGRANIRSFWLAGHSQGGITAQRIVCNDFFRTRVDGLLSLSGGRIGPTQLAPDFFAPPPGGTPPGDTAPPPRPAAVAAPSALPTCDFSYIYAVGEHEILGLPETTPLAQKYGCGARTRRPDVIDDKAGYVTGADQPRNASYGRMARPGVAQVMVYPDCRDGRLVADVLRLDKGHTEGLEPKITEEILKLIVGVPTTERGTR
jgi:pimeloyl-ACP methyl ester carboxylesterase